MKGLIFNFGDVGILESENMYHIKYIKENYLESIGVRTHYDPDLICWTLGDYPNKSSKIHLKDLDKNDIIFFTSSLRDQKKIRKQYFAAMMEIDSIITLEELRDRYTDNEIANLERLNHNPHILRYFYGNGENLYCTFFIGNPEKSFIIKKPLPFDRNLVRNLFEKFPADKYRGNIKYNWYYNNPNFPNIFGLKKNKKGNLLTDTSLIGSKFRNAPLLPKEITKWLLIELKKLPRLSEDEYFKYGINHIDLKALKI